ncbi:MAG: transposase [Acidobacteriia bacterium]|nr:transposase [Terriglobia bacterium]
MDTVAPEVLTRDEMENRRFSAAEAFERGLSQSEVARQFNVSRTTASRWRRALNGNGVASLRKRRATGRPSRLNAAQLAELRDIYHAGPEAVGLGGGRWTTGRFAEAIFRRFGVRYDPDHAGRIIHRLGLRPGRDLAPVPQYDAAIAYGSRYSPNTVLSRSDISPTVA